MAERSHTIGKNWREADAVALEERVFAITDWLDHTENLTYMLNGDDKTVTELRTIAGVMKSKRNDYRAQAEALRAELGKES